jgi:cytochrome c oxidase subunit II
MRRLGLMLAALGLSACEPDLFKAVHLPLDASRDGWRIDEMIHSTTNFVLLIFAVMIVWLGIVFTRHGKRHTAAYDHGNDAKSFRWTLATAGLIFFVVDGDLLLSSLSAIREVYGNFAMAEAQPGAVRIEVTAHQWAWAFRYPGPDGKFDTPDDVVTLNEVVLPEGQPAIFEVASTDVIHSFNVPQMRMKVDAVPGTINNMWFVPKLTGTWEIACAQHCGANHYKMRGLVTVVSEADYAAWLRVAQANAASAFDPDDAAAHWGWDWARHARIP